MPRAQVAQRALCAALVAAALPGCGDGGSGAGHVVARVNGADITIHQLDNELAMLGIAPAGRDDRNAKRVIESLVDQQLLVSEATQAKLDRDPQVLLVMERARRQILSEAFLERSLKVPQPGAEELKSFYSTHAELFQKRRVYTFHDYLIERAELPESLRARLEAAKSRDDAEAILRGAGITWRTAASTRGAEQLPIEMLPRIAAMAKGDFALLESGSTTILLQLVDYAEQPITLEQASPFIEQYLVSARRKELAARMLKDLRATAHIAYIEGSLQRTQARPPAQAAADDREFIRRGVQGLAGK